MVPVLSSSGKVPPLQCSLPASSSQKMVLYPVKSTSGVQYYRRADGQLYRLLPMSQLRPFARNQPGQTGECACGGQQRSGGQPVSFPPPGPQPPLLPVVVRQTVPRAPPVTSVITNVLTVNASVSSTSTFTSSASSTATSPESSGLGRCVPSLPSPLLPPAGLLSQEDERPSQTTLTSSTSETGAPPAVPQEATPPPAPALRGSEDVSVQQIGSELELAFNPSDESSSSDESLDFADGDVCRDEVKDQLRKNVSFDVLLFGSPCWKVDRTVLVIVTVGF